LYRPKEQQVVLSALLFDRETLSLLLFNKRGRYAGMLGILCLAVRLCLRYTKREPVPPILLTRFGGQPPNGCESNLGASGTDANEKGSHVPLISAIVTVSSPPTLAIGELEMITVEEREAIRRAYYLYVDTYRVN